MRCETLTAFVQLTLQFRLLNRICKFDLYGKWNIIHSLDGAWKWTTGSIVGMVQRALNYQQSQEKVDRKWKRQREHVIADSKQSMGMADREWKGKKEMEEGEPGNSKRKG